MITYFRFLLLTTEEKIQYLRQEGVFLMNQSGPRTRVELYALGSYFVEVHYKNPEDEVMEVVAFKNTDRLQQYIQSIFLNGVAVSWLYGPIGTYACNPVVVLHSFQLILFGQTGKVVRMSWLLLNRAWSPTVGPWRKDSIFLSVR